MAEDLQIQQVPQQKGNYAVPGLIAGAAIGGIGGAVAANYGLGIHSKVDLDKVFTQKPDVFDRMIKNASEENQGMWKTAKDFAKQIQDKGAEFDGKLKEIENVIPKLNEGRKSIATKLVEFRKGEEYKNLLETIKTAKNNNDPEAMAKAQEALTTKLKEISSKAGEEFGKTESGKALADGINKLKEKGITNVRNSKQLLKQLGKKEDYVKELVTKAKEALKDSADKFKLPSKTWTGIVVGALLAVAGCAIGAAINKDKQA